MQENSSGTRDSLNFFQKHPFRTGNLRVWGLFFCADFFSGAKGNSSWVDYFPRNLSMFESTSEV